MTRRTAWVALASAGLLVLGQPASAQQTSLGLAAVVRAWSAALNRGDNEAAANLFARNAVVVQNGLELHLTTHHLAVLWNEGLPCTGRIIKITVKGDLADATFVLGNRKTSNCDAPGQKARARSRSRGGRSPSGSSSRLLRGAARRRRTGRPPSRARGVERKPRAGRATRQRRRGRGRARARSRGRRS